MNLPPCGIKRRNDTAKGAFGRIADILQADVDDVLSRMEDPKKLIGQMIQEMEESVNTSVAAVCKSLANEKLMDRRIRERSEEAERWGAKAQQAVQSGEDELARKALEQKLRVEADLEMLKRSMAEAEEATLQLRQQLDRLKAKLQEAKSQQRSIIAKHQISQSGVIQSRLSQVNEDAFHRFEEFKNKVEEAEISAELYEDVAGTHPGLEADLEKMEKKQRIQEELEKLKGKTAASNPKNKS